MEHLEAVFVQALLESKPTDEPIWLGLDSSSMPRPEAASSRDRGMIYVPNLLHATKPVSVGWQYLHFRETPQTKVSVIRVLREAARDSKRDPREGWFIWTGEQDVPLEQIRIWYGKRFSQEHGYRFLRQDLLWTQAHLRTPEQVERWSWIVACACNQLLLAQPLGLQALRPWESKERAATPRQVHRVMPSLLWQLGTPAASPKPRGKSPGWRIGRARTPAPRFAVVKKPKPVPKTHRKRA